MFFFFSSRRRHTRCSRDWSSDVCSSDLDVLAPLPVLRLVPSGGVSLENAGEWIRAGAAAVSVGSALASAALLTDESTAELTARARSFVERVAQARRHPGHAQ